MSASSIFYYFLQNKKETPTRTFVIRSYTCSDLFDTDKWSTYIQIRKEQKPRSLEVQESATAIRKSGWKLRIWSQSKLKGMMSYQEEEEQEEVYDNSDGSDGSDEGSDFSTEIHEVITKYNENPLELSTFSIGGEIEDAMGVPAVHVEGVGRIAYPLCTQQTVDLLSVSSQAPFGKGKETVVDVNVRRAWQIDCSLVKINQKWLDNALPKLVAQCCAKLGIDAVKMKVRANLYKMLLYEEGGHFKKHRDTEKEPGMFGSLLIQLPAEHEGGHLVVELDKTIKRYPFDKESADKGYYTAFYADCEHTLEPVTKGLRLVLAFNLVRVPPSGSSATTLAPASAAHRRGYEDVLVAASKAWLAKQSAVQKLVVPLAHQYTRTNVSFAGLKGTDRSTLGLLQDVRDPVTNEKVFTVYLALVTKHVSGQGDEDDYCDDEDKEVSYETDTWVGPNGAVDLGNLSVDFNEEIITATEESDDEAAEDIFGSRPDRKEDEGYQGNYPGTVEYWYYSAVLVFWPAQRDFDIKLAADPTQAVALLEDVDRTSPDYAQKVARLLSFLASRPTSKSWQPSRVLALSLTLEQVQMVIGMCRTRTLSETDAIAITALVGKHGWATLGKDFAALIKSQTPAAVTALLDKLNPFCNSSGLDNVSSSSAVATVSVEVWNKLVRILASKCLQSTVMVPPSTSYYRSYPTSTVAPSVPMLQVSEADWFYVSRFIQTHCDAEDQVAIATHISSLLKLPSLNNLIERLLSVGEFMESAFQTQLYARAVQQCIDKSQTGADVIAALRWILRGHHDDLLTKILPALRRLCDKAEHAELLFSVPEVLDELKTDSATSQALMGLVQARIAAVAPHTIAPVFSWRMSAKQVPTNDARVPGFLTSDMQTVSLAGGFGGIIYARKWITQYLGNNRGACGVTGEAYGSGQGAGVRLTKNKLVHDAAVKRCAANAAELQRLRKLLRVHDRDTAIGTNTSGDNMAPEPKKAKVEPHIYVID